uniref:DUF1738 domain-containing protein n=1 Tax=Ascaris lumbricoides TaxID=6252 RepID=A0A0M3ISC5_ASCLU
MNNCNIIIQTPPQEKCAKPHRRSMRRSRLSVACYLDIFSLSRNGKVGKQLNQWFSRSEPKTFMDWTEVFANDDKFYCIINTATSANNYCQNDKSNTFSSTKTDQ